MRRDKAINVFLFFMLTALLFVSLYPIYFSPGEIHIRTVTLAERLLSLLFVIMWTALCVYSAWKKRFALLAGGVMYSILAYLPGLFLPHLESAGAGSDDPGFLSAVFRVVFVKMYELVSAPLAGISLLVSRKASTSLSKWLLPVLLISYAGTQLFRFYRNAYLAEQLHLEDTASYSNPGLARELGLLPLGVPSFTPAASGVPGGAAAGTPDNASGVASGPASLNETDEESDEESDAPDEMERTRLRYPGMPK